MLLWERHKISSLSGLGLVPCDARVSRRPVHIVSRVDLHWDQSVSICEQLRVERQKGNIVSIPSRLHGHIEQYNVFELLHDRSFDMNLGFLA